ncbi:MAG: hypothetical protein FD165_1953, partial [Gammaproteobacteria bacterium]
MPNQFFHLCVRNQALLRQRFNTAIEAALFAVALTCASVGDVTAAALLGSNAASPGTVNLTTEGTTDWAHWGLTSAS